MRIKLGLLMVAGLLLLLAAPVRADTVLFSAAPVSPICGYCGWDLDPDHWHAVSWTFSSTFTNVSITLPLSIYPAPYSGTAWITNALGPGTTASNIIATTTFSNVNSSNFYVGNVTFFSGLTLGPGTYYMFISASSGGAMVVPLYAANWVIHTAPGVTAGGDYIALGPNNAVACCYQDAANPPASDWRQQSGWLIPITITGTSAVPEPGTLLLVATGIAGFWLRRRASA